MNRYHKRECAFSGPIFTVIYIFVFMSSITISWAQTNQNEASAVDLLIRLAQFYIGSGEWEKAAEQLQDALRRDPNNSTAERLLVQVRQQQRSAKPNADEKSTGAVRTEIKILGGLSGDGQKTAKSPKKAKVNLSFQEKLKVDSALKKGIEFMSNGIYDEARKSFEAVLALDPSNYEALYQTGIIQYNTGQLEKSASTFQELSAENENDSNAFYWLASSLYSLKKYNDAERAMQRALEINDRDPYSHALLGKIYKGSKELMKAEQHYLLALTLDNTVPEALEGLGEVYLEGKNWNKAESTLREYIRLYPDAGPGYLFLAATYFGQGMRERCLEMLAKAEQYSPDHGLIPFLQGELKKQDGALIQAIELYQKALQLDPYQEQAYFSLTQIYTEIGKYNEALSTLDRAAGKVGKPFAIHMEKGKVYERQNQMQKAMTEYEIAVNLAPKDLNALMKLGEVYGINEWYLDAMDQYNKVLELAPSHPKAAWIKTELSRLKSLESSSSQSRTAPVNNMGQGGGSGGGSASDFF